MTRIFSVALVTSLVSGTAFAQTAEPPAAPAPAETSNLKISMFADAYYNFSTSKNYDAMGAATGAPGHRAYSASNGFSLSFLGTDIVYETEKFGATASLRFGPSVPIFYGRGSESNPDFMAFGINNILQAFATWKPTDKLKIDFGQFGTIYGAEVAESWKNMNYTRGGLYYAMQPFWHTGVRAALSVSDELTVTGMIVNGVNNIIDNGKELPSVGIQAAYSTDSYSLIVGYLGSLDPSADALFDHFVDVVATTNLGKLNLIFNGDFAMDTKTGNGNTQFFGVSLAGGVSLTDTLGVALRGEYLADPDGTVWGAGDLNVITGTVTLDYKPDPSGKLIIRWDNRFEKASESIFSDRDGAAADTWIQSVLGLVVTSD